MSEETGLAPGARILVIGASSGIGRETCASALEAGSLVRGFARSITRRDFRHEAFEAVAGDALDREAMVRAMEGCDAVVQSLGIRADPATLLAPVSLFSQATGVMLEAMAQNGVRRVVAVTGYGIGDSRRALALPERIAFEAVMGRVAADKERQEDLLRASDAHWTILRPGFLTRAVSCPSARLRVDPADWRNGFVSRRDVAAQIVTLLRTGAYDREAVVFT